MTSWTLPEPQRTEYVESQLEQLNPDLVDQVLDEVARKGIAHDSAKLNTLWTGALHAARVEHRQLATMLTQLARLIAFARRQDHQAHDDHRPVDGKDWSALYRQVMNMEYLLLDGKTAVHPSPPSGVTGSPGCPAAVRRGTWPRKRIG